MTPPLVLIVGTGSIGERHARCFLATGRARVAIVETDPQRRREVAQRYAVPDYPSVEEGLDCRPALAVVCTPAHLHIPVAQLLVEQGVHVLIEKPLSTSLQGVSALCQAVAASGVTAGVAYVYRSFSEVAAMRQAIRDGRFGRPLELVAVCGQHFPTYRPAYREIYYARHETGGGAIQDALTHVINAAEWLVGPVDRLAADACHLRLPGVEVEDTVHLLARHGAVRAVYALNQHQAPNEMALTVVCEKATARCEVHNQRWMFMEDPGGQWQVQSFPPRDRDAAFIAQAQAFLDATGGQQPFVCTLEEALQTLKANLAALRSAREERWVSVAEIA